MESPKPNHSRRILGIEGGGTKTQWVLLDDQAQVLCEGRAPAANLKLLSDSDLSQLFGTLPPDATHVGAFLAGCVLDSDRARLSRIASTSWPGAVIRVGNDLESGFATALGEGDGLVVICGTGAVVHGRHQGRMDKAGGWGHILGDRGGGYDIARFALRQAIRHYDLEHSHSRVASSILTHLGLNDLKQLDDWVIHADRTMIASLAPVAFDAAEFDSELYEFIAGRAARLADFTVAVARRLGLDSRPTEVRLLGSLLNNVHWYRELYANALHERFPHAHVEPCTKSGAFGAASLAVASPLPAPPDVDLARTERDELASAVTEQRHARASELDRLSARELVDLFIAEEDRVRLALAACATSISHAVELITAAFRNGGRLFYVGAGTSGRLGVLDASEIPPTFGTSPEMVQGVIAGGSTALLHAIEGAEDSKTSGAAVINGRSIRDGDVVCGITASGRTPFVLGALESARMCGARTILLSCNPSRSPSQSPWDVEIDLPTGPEIIAGSTRLKAGTATKVTLNIFTSCAMILLGRVRGGTMLDVRATNAKLRDRAVRIVCAALNTDADSARSQLEASGWSVRAVLDGKRTR